MDPLTLILVILGCWFLAALVAVVCAGLLNQVVTQDAQKRLPWAIATAIIAGLAGLILLAWFLGERLGDAVNDRAEGRPS